MHLLSIDVETTGLDPSYCSILEVGAVLFDPQPPLAIDGKVNEEGRRPATFECLIKHSRIQGEPYALQMNQELLAEIAGTKETYRPIFAASYFTRMLAEFLKENGVTNCSKATVVGKNYDRFDRQFLLRIPGWSQYVEPLLERRTLDVGSLYFNPEDGRLKNLQECLGTIGVRKEIAHRALDDALDVMTSITRVFN